MMDLIPRKQNLMTGEPTPLSLGHVKIDFSEQKELVY